MNRTSPLDARHRAAGARMVPFGGWEMPLEYEGTLAEHRACRTDAVVFDVSHLGTVRVGADARQRLQESFTNNLDKIAPGRAQYTHLLDDSDGSVLDDIIVWWRPDGGFDVMPNASNTDRVLAAVGGRATTADRVVLAVQGPNWQTVAAQVAPEVSEVGRFRVAQIDWCGVELTVAGTGYTGEPGVEIAAPVEAAEALWDRLIESGAAPAGLGARDTLRLEAGLPLHGHELGPQITPFQAGLGWVVDLDKPEFSGRTALLAERARGIDRQLRGVATEGRRPLRAGAQLAIEGAVVGELTSGNVSPMLGHGIGLGFVPPDTPAGQPIDVVLRGQTIRGEVVATPFYPPRSLAP